MTQAVPVPEHRPTFPDQRPGVAILGCGRIARTAHLPAYATHGVEVVGIWSRRPESLADISDPQEAVVYRSPEELLADPNVGIVDIATPAEGRLEWISRAVDAGKHVLAQKPLTFDLSGLAPVLATARRHGVRVAVNQNARWAPAWRVATDLVAQGAIGDVVGVTHLLDKPLPPLAGTPFDDIEHMLIVDYLMHWIDISRCWLGGKVTESVRAVDSRVPGQPVEAKNPWAASIHLQCTDGASAALRIVGDARTKRPACPFWIHGTEGTVRGSILGGSDRVTLERGDTITDYALEGQWFVDGFAGAMGELMLAVAQDREPEHSAEHVRASLELVLAAHSSAEQGGAVVAQEVRL